MDPSQSPLQKEKSNVKDKEDSDVEMIENVEESTNAPKIDLNPMEDTEMNEQLPNDQEMEQQTTESNQEMEVQIVEQEKAAGNSNKVQGHITLEIKNFSEIVKKAKAGHEIDSDALTSSLVKIGGETWKMFVDFYDSGKMLGVFVQHANEKDDENWSCVASAKFWLHTFENASESFSKVLKSKKLTPKEDYRGVEKFKLTDDILDEKKNFISNDTIVLEAELTFEMPNSLDNNDYVAYNGLVNQGATCYMNSILQMFFFTNKLRQAVYSMPTENDVEDSSVSLALQCVFYNLQYSDKAVDTQKLTKSFGWDSSEAFHQHDVQEFCRILLDSLETKMKNTEVEGSIAKLFKGTMRSYVSCIDIDYESTRDEPFYDVQLNVKGNASVLESFRGYVEPEILDGENLYDAEQYGKQKANKGVKFVALPPILHLQLMRFQYNFETDTNEKINDRFEFPDILDLNEFIEGSNGEYVYRLQTVLVHCGSSRGGHYTVFIDTDLCSDTPKWCRFNDASVTACLSNEAIEDNFGGMSGVYWRNAYMLVYVQQSKIPDLLCQVEASDQLRQRFEKEHQEKLEEERIIEMSKTHQRVFLVSDNDLKTDHFIYDIGNYDVFKTGKSCTSCFISKNPTAADFYEEISEELDISVNDFRLWRYESIEHGQLGKECHRPSTQILHEPKSRYNFRRNSPFGVHLDNIFYVERAVCFDSDSEIDEKLAPYVQDKSILVFIKFYDSETSSFVCIGSLIVRLDKPFSDYHSKIESMLNLQTDTDLVFHLVTSRATKMIENNQTLNNLKASAVDGSIIVVEDEENLSTDNNFELAVKQICESIKIKAIPNVEKVPISSSPESETFCFDMHTSSTLNELCTLIAEKLDCDSDNILIWKPTAYEEKPAKEAYLLKDLSSKTILDAIFNKSGDKFDPRSANNTRLVSYSKISVPVQDFKKHAPFPVTLLGYSNQLKEVTLFVPKSGKVVDVLKAAQSEFDFDPNGTSKLRLLCCEKDKAESRIIQESPESTSFEHGIQNMLAKRSYRIEEVLHDQLELESNERLISVFHYENTSMDVFGLSFLIKFVDGDPILAIKQRIQEILQVPDQEFEKFEFTIVGRHTTLPLDDGFALDFDYVDDLEQKEGLVSIGLKHANKDKKRYVQKSIVIHN